jgi:predicted RNase H-like nuclease (RuvC/YqgF family)
VSGTRPNYADLLVQRGELREQLKVALRTAEVELAQRDREAELLRRDVADFARKVSERDERIELLRARLIAVRGIVAQPF